MGDDKILYPKSNFLMCITTLRKIDVQMGDSESSTWRYKVISSEWKKCSGKIFRDSIYEARKNGENIDVKIVNERPEKFVVNQIYMLPTRDRVWVWVEEKED